MNKYIVIGIVVIVVVGVLGIVFKQRQNNKDIEMIEAVASGETASPAASGQPNQDEPIPAEDISGPTLEEEEKMFAHDKDRDGITDSEEERMGTSDEAFDTDKDGISDQLELTVWKTDPTNPDTDGDGFPDGVEILEGFNPLGEGRL